MRAQRAIHRLTAVLAAGCLCLLLAGWGVAEQLPDRFLVTDGQPLDLTGLLPVTVHPAGRSVAAAENGPAAPQTAEVRLWGLVPVGQVETQPVEPRQVVPLGRLFGVRLYTDGVLVVGLTPVDTADGAHSPAEEAGVRTGDLLLAVNGRAVTANREVAAALTQSEGAAVTLTLRRQNVLHTLSLQPCRATDGAWRAGLWVRDSSAGLGTLTFYDPASGMVAGLGHGVCDVDTGALLPAARGEMVTAETLGVTKARPGVTGELRGRFAGRSLAVLTENSERGVYGLAAAGAFDGVPVPVALRQQVHTGEAALLCTVDGQTKAYAVRIVSLRLREDDTLQNMVVEVTDPALLEQTGGIVQGMSGSPILQDGRLAGALTHVFVNQPTRGYAIFADTMLHAARRQTADEGAKAS